MSVPFVSFPGVAGNYISTPDENVLPDADTAHGQQGTGVWVTASGLQSMSVEAAPQKPPYGATVLMATGVTPGGTSIQVRSGVNGADAPAVVAGETYSWSMYVFTGNADREVNMRLRWSDGTSVQPAQEAVPVGVWTRFHATGVAPAGVTSVECHIRFHAAAGNVGDGEIFYMSTGVLRTGSDPTFLPSLRIVGGLEVSHDLSARWVSSSQDSEFLIGRDDSAGTRAYGIALRPSSKVYRMRIVDDLGANFNLDANIASHWPSADGERITLRATWLPSTGVCEVFVNGDLAGTASSGVKGGILPGDSVLTVGYASGFGTAAMLDGDVYSMELLDGVGGPVVARYDAEDVPI